jgi:PilZ domain
MASGQPGIDYPEDKEPVDVQVASRGDTLTSFVEGTGDDPLVLSVPVDRSGLRVRVDVGEHVQLVWRGPEELRALPAELVEVVLGDEPRWRLRPAGPATRGQRRNAVRAPLSLPVEVRIGRVQLIGDSIDVSEGGLHCLFQPAEQDGGTAEASTAGVPVDGTPSEDAPDAAETAPEPAPHPVAMGAVMELTLALDEQQPPIRSKVEVVRLHPRTDRRIELSVRFIGLHEREEDRIRARVFSELRQLRARGVL